MSTVPDPSTTVTTPPEPVQYEGGAAAPAAAQKDAPYTSQYAHIDLCPLHQPRYRFLNITNTVLLAEDDCECTRWQDGDPAQGNKVVPDSLERACLLCMPKLSITSSFRLVLSGA